LNTILSVRRFTCALAAFLVLAPAGLRLAASAFDSDWEAKRCAIACGHAVNAGATGKVCCPMGSAEGGVSMTTCPSSDAPAAVPLAPGPLAILTPTTPLAAPEGGACAITISPSLPRGPDARPPDHIPLILS
jgi:hypothetical protein